MQFRRLLILGFCSSLAISTSAAVAAPPQAIAPVEVSASSDVVNVAAPKTDKKPGKKTAAKAKGKNAKAKPLTKEEQAAQAKAEAKAKKEAEAKEKAEAKAKAKADKDKALAKAKAEKEKQLAADKAAKEKKLAADKAEKAKQLAEKKKADDARKAAQAKADEERRVAKAKAEEDRKLAKAKAAEDKRLAAEAKAKAAEDARVAKIRAEEERRAAAAKAAEDARQAERVRLASAEIAQTGNNGELRSESVEAPKPTGLFAGLFGGSSVKKQSMLPETRALDAALELKEQKKPFKVRPEFVPTVVDYSGYARGTIVIDTAAHYLYLIESSSKARRYAIAVGKDGLQYKGQVKVGDKQEWPRWIPTKEMQKRDPKRYGQYAEGMPGGGQNPLGARAIYLYENGKDTHLRIHGTIAPETIGTDSSNGCFRMINDHVIDLYRRVPMGTSVVVL